MANLKDIAATLAILGSSALIMSGCGKDAPASEVPAGDAAAPADDVAADAGDAAGGEGEGSCGGEGEGGEGSCGGEGEGGGEGGEEASCGGK